LIVNRATNFAGHRNLSAEDACRTFVILDDGGDRDIADFSACRPDQNQIILNVSIVVSNLATNESVELVHNRIDN
jgi:hypothetical protein